MCADVSPAHEIFSHGYHQVWFEGAEVPTIDRIPAALLGAVAEARDALDMDRMAQCAAAPLHSTQATNAAPARTGGARSRARRLPARPRRIVRRFRRQHLESLEDSPTSVLVDPLIRFCLYEPAEQEADADARGESLRRSVCRSGALEPRTS